MNLKNIKYILTDIEGTTTSVSFVYEVLFPYFREHIDELKSLIDDSEVQKAFKKTVEISRELEGKTIRSVDEVIETLERWSREDRKITPLKSLQGLLWEKGYRNGEIKGHVYADVKPALHLWTEAGIQLGVFSSGSVTAQKLIFGYSQEGDLTRYFSHYFDTETGGKRESHTYEKIATNLNLFPQNILFLSDVVEELKAAQDAGYQTIQLVRPGTNKSWDTAVKDFSEINLG